MPTQIDNCIIRCQLIKTHDDDEQQKLEAYGRYNERYGGTDPALATPRLQEYGYSSYAPEGSQGVTNIPNGNPDMAFITKVMDPKTRWKKLAAEGNIVEYDKWQHRRLKEEKKWTDKVGNACILLTEEGDICHLNPPSTIVRDWQVHRDGSKYSPDELAVLETQEREAELQRESVIAESRARHDEFMLRIEAMERRIYELEVALAAYRSAR